MFKSHRPEYTFYPARQQAPAPRPRLWIFCLLAAVGCGQQLPEPDSAGAQLYRSYCSAKGCHDPIPPQRGGKRYWDLQMKRMLALLEQQGRPLPDAGERQAIIGYLHRNAQGSRK